MSDDRDENRRVMALVFILLATALCFFFVTMIWIVGPAKSAEASPAVAYCALYAREQVRIDLMHTLPVKASAVTDAYIEDMAVKVFKECVSVIPALLPLPEQHRSLRSWINDMRYLLEQRAREGTAPASDDNWRAQCERTYRTWDEDTGTVIRKGSHERTRCPCGDEVTCD